MQVNGYRRQLLGYPHSSKYIFCAQQKKQSTWVRVNDNRICIFGWTPFRRTLRIWLRQSRQRMNFMMSIRNSKCFWSGIRHHVDALKCWLQILQVQLNPNQFFFFSGINSWRNWPESGWCAWSERCAGSGDGYLNYSLPSFDSDVCRWWLPCWKGLKIVSSPWLQQHKASSKSPSTQ